MGAKCTTTATYAVATYFYHYDVPKPETCFDCLKQECGDLGLVTLKYEEDFNFAVSEAAKLPCE